jgi:hypothetical protein
MTTIRVIDSDVPGTTLIEQTEPDGITVSSSYWHDVIPIEARLNPDAPPATEARTGYPEAQYEWAMPDATLWAFMDGNRDGRAEERRQALRAVMKAAGRDVDHEVGFLE